MSQKNDAKRLHEMVVDIMEITQKHEVPYGLDSQGEIMSTPDPIFVAFLENQVNILKKRLGLPLFVCKKCGFNAKTVWDLY